MNKLIHRCLMLLALGLLCSAFTNAQVPRTGDVKTIVVTDDNFEPQKNTDRGPTRRGRLLYEVWITTDGVLHCKTSKLASAEIHYNPPVLTSISNGGSTSSGGGWGRILNVNKPDFSDTHYTFALKPDKYKEMHSIVLTLRSGLLGTAVVTLTNKKVPAEIINKP